MIGAQAMADALMEMTGLMGNGSAMRRLVLRLFVKFAGEQLSADEFERIVEESDGESWPQMDTDGQVISTDEDTN